MIESASDSAAPPSRARVVAQRVGLVAQLAIAAVGALGMWEARTEGRPVSRPSAIAFWAGLVGLIVSVAAPRIRAVVRRRRRDV